MPKLVFLNQFEYKFHLLRNLSAYFIMNHSVSVQGDNTVAEGLIWAPSALLSLRVRLDVRRLRITQKIAEITRLGACCLLYTDAILIGKGDKL